MKKIFFFIIITSFLSGGCDEIYDGGERNVIEGQIIFNNQPVAYKEIVILSFDRFNDSLINLSQPFKEIFKNTSDRVVLSTQKTDANGNFKFGVPGGHEKAYYIRIDDRLYGYISYYNMPNHYFNTGSIDISATNSAQ